MATYVLCSTPNYGHVAPLLTVGEHLVHSGHRVVFLSGSPFVDRARAGGVEPVALPAAADLDFDAVDSILPDRDRHRGLARTRYEIGTIFVRTIPAQFQAVRSLLAEVSPDAVLVDSAFAGVLPLLLDDGPRPPVLGAGVLPLIQHSRDVAPYGSALPPSSTTLGRLRNRALTLAVERVAFRPLQTLAQQMLAEVGSPPLATFVLDFSALFDRFLQFSVAEFEYPRSDLAPNTRFVGPVLPAAGSNGEVPAWWSDLDGSRPVVHVTQGTMDNKDFGRLIGPTIAGLSGRDLLVVVTTGGRPVADLGDLPANVRAAEFLPYDRLLPKVDVYVTNGGYGGVQYALAHGVPLVVAGDTEDKPEVAARVAYSGAGVDLKTGTPAPEAIASGVQRVLSDPAHRSAAQRMAAAMAGTSALATVEEELRLAVQQR
jgi:MGT family glycosyltransferase